GQGIRQNLQRRTQMLHEQRHRSGTERVERGRSKTYRRGAFQKGGTGRQGPERVGSVRRSAFRRCFHQCARAQASRAFQTDNRDEERMGIMGGNRGSIHKNIDIALADINAVFKTHLVVVDATRILTAHGPQGGDIRDVKKLNKVIASTDIVAADAYATTLFGLKPEDISVTLEAHRRGLGEMKVERMKILKV